MFTRSKPITPLPFVIYLVILALLMTIGLADAIYLSISHYRVYTDIGYKSFCALSRSINCDTVSQSPYSIFWGTPVPVWGIFGYTFLLLLLPFAGCRDAAKTRMWSLLFWVSFIYALISLILAFISAYYVRSYCIMCIVSYGVNLFLLLYSWIVSKRFSTSGLVRGLKKDILFLWQKRKQSLPPLLTFFAAAMIISMIFPAYWEFKPTAPSATLPSGITEEGHPWIGAERPQLEITEFADYQCFQCKKMHFFLRQLIAEQPQKIRLIHRHYPMDHTINPIVKAPFHEGSGAMALIATSAARMKKFWPVNDYLFGIAGRAHIIDIKKLAEKVDLNFEELKRNMSDRNSQIALRRDIWQGNKLKITGTPAYLIEHNLYLGQIPSDVLKNALE